MRYLLDLDGDEAALIRLLKRLLKILGRTYGVRVKGLEPVKPSDG